MLPQFPLYRSIAVVVGLLGLSLLVWLLWPAAESVVLDEQPVEEVEESVSNVSVIGNSVEGRVIEAYTYGDGETHLLFIGGIHGGYEWNSTLLAYDMMELFEEDPDLIPKNIKVTIIPSANPDGLYKVIPKEGRITWDDAPIAANDLGVGRMNANDVDLNRNFDCKWQGESTWRGNAVSAGMAPFSEPEAAAIRSFVLTNEPAAVIFWHSQANAVYASECLEGILPVTLDIMNAYATAADYAAVESFDHYPVTGDAEGWLASIGIPAITVELSTHETTDWNRNVAGVNAVFEYFSNP